VASIFGDLKWRMDGSLISSLQAREVRANPPSQVIPRRKSGVGSKLESYRDNFAGRPYVVKNNKVSSRLFAKSPENTGILHRQKKAAPNWFAR